jgi:hypothetical protein
MHEPPHTSSPVAQPHVPSEKHEYDELLHDEQIPPATAQWFHAIGVTHGPVADEQHPVLHEVTSHSHE